MKIFCGSILALSGAFIYLAERDQMAPAVFVAVLGCYLIISGCESK